MYIELFLISFVLGIVMYLAFLCINFFMKNSKRSILILVLLTIITYFSVLYFTSDKAWLIVGLIILSPIPIIGGLVALILGWIIRLIKKKNNKTRNTSFFLSAGFKGLLEGIIVIIIIISFIQTKPSNWLEAIKYRNAYVKGGSVAGDLTIRTSHLDYKPELLKPVYYANQDIPAVTQFNEEDLEKLSFIITYHPMAKYTLHPVIFDMEDFNKIRRISKERSSLPSAITFEKWEYVHVSFFNTASTREQELWSEHIIDTLEDKRTQMFYLMVDGKYIVEDIEMEKLVMLQGYLKLSFNELIYQIIYYTILSIILVSLIELIVFVVKRKLII